MDQEFGQALTVDPNRFCIREFVKLATLDQEASQVFSSLLHFFPPISKHESSEVCHLLKNLLSIGSSLSILSFGKLISADFSQTFVFFLKQLFLLPQYDKVSQFANSFLGDCSKWVEIYGTLTSSMVYSAKRISSEEYTQTITQLNPKLTLEKYENFATEFRGILDTAADNNFIETPYHMLILEYLFQLVETEVNSTNQFAVIGEIPTGCGKSWLLTILGAAIKQKYKCNVLITTPNNFLAKFAEENCGYSLGFAYNKNTDSYLSYSKFIDIASDLQTPTFVLIDEIDDYLFLNPFHILENSVKKHQRILWKTECLKNMNIAGILGVTGTLDKNYGTHVLKNYFSQTKILRTPTLDNKEAVRNFTAGMKEGSYSTDEKKMLWNLTDEVEKYCDTQPVIIIASDSEQAAKFQHHLMRSMRKDVELMTELSQIGEIQTHDKFYQRVKTKLKKFQKQEQVILVITKNDARGIDFKFKPGVPPTHIIISFETLSSSELRQAIGRSCRQMQHHTPSWSCVLLDKDDIYDDEMIVDLLEGKESSLSCFGTEQWMQMAGELNDISELLLRLKKTSAEQIEQLKYIAEALNSNRYGSSQDFHSDLMNAGVSKKNLKELQELREEKRKMKSLNLATKKVLAKLEEERAGEEAENTATREERDQ